MARSICFYTDSRVWGGADHALLTLIEVLDRSAWKPTVLLHDAAGMDPLVRRAGELEVPITIVPPMPLGLAGALRIPKFARTLTRQRPAVFHAHLSWPLAAKYGLAGAVAARVPAVVATIHHFSQLDLGRSSSFQLRALAVGVGRYIATSGDVKAALIDRLQIPTRKIEVVANGVAPERFTGVSSPRLRTELSGGSVRFILLTCARLDSMKGLDVLLRAARELPEARFVIAGEGPERAALELQVKQLGLVDSVVFLGQRDDVPALLAAADAVVLPSLYETTSQSLLEAMAASRPVVTTAIPGTDELIVDGESGLLVPPSDHAALATALRRLLADSGLRTSLARRARDRVEQEFTAEQMGARVTRIYETLLGG